MLRAAMSSIFYDSSVIAQRKAASNLWIQGVVFDMDGTLTIPILDFVAMRAALGITAQTDVLQHLKSLEGDKKHQAEAIVKEMEHQAMVNMKLQPGFEEIMTFLDDHGIPKGILTRNNLLPVNHLVQTSGTQFHKIVTRECFQPTKPAPEPLLHICVDTWKLRPQCVMMVGDHLDDLQCGRNAGCVTVLLRNPNNTKFEDHADIVVNSLSELVKILQEGFDLKTTTKQA